MTNFLLIRYYNITTDVTKKFHEYIPVKRGIEEKYPANSMFKSLYLYFKAICMKIAMLWEIKFKSCINSKVHNQTQIKNSSKIIFIDGYDGNVKSF